MSIHSYVGHALMHTANQALEPGWTAAKYVTAYVAPLDLPSTDQILELAARGLIPETRAESALRIKGAAASFAGGPDATDPTGSHKSYVACWDALHRAKQHHPEGGELREVANRQLFDDADMLAYVHLEGFADDQERKWIANLRYDIPGPADLVRFSVRHCWEPDILARFGYADEFPGKIIDVWHAFKGLDYPLFTGPFEQQIAQITGDPNFPISFANQYWEATGSEPTWAQFYWYSHWVLPSPTQGYLMWQRLLPGRNPKWDGPEMLGVNFSYDDLKLLLRANDYPPFYRDKLAAISRPIPGIRYARSFLANGVYTEDDLFQWTQRQGYSRGDGNDITNAIANDVAKAANKATTCSQCKLVESAYQVGVISAADLETYYKQFGLTSEEASTRAGIVKLELSISRSRGVITSVRKRFLTGALSAGQAQDLLTSYGLVQQRVTEYVQDWQLELAGPRKQASTGQVMKWACNGYISGLELEARLTNMGYPPDEIVYLLEEAASCAAALQTKAAAAQAKKQQQSINALKAQQKAAAQQIQMARKALSSHGTPTQLRKWFCEGHIGEMEVFQRLTFLGWPDCDIYRLIGDCKSGGPSVTIPPSCSQQPGGTGGP